MPKVSIIVPFYNVEKYIEKCLQTLVNQTLADIEIILVNDGSQDGTEEIAKKYQEQYPQKIKYLEKENGGLSDARNYAIPYATGEYVAFLDSDDYIDIQLYNIIKQYIERDIELIKFKLQRVDENNNIIEKVTGPIFEKTTGEEGFKYLYASDVLLDSPCVYVMKKDIFIRNKLLFNVGTEHEDFGLIPFVIVLARSMISIDFYGYQYVQSNGSITRNNDYNKTKKKAYDALKQYDEALIKIEKYNINKNTADYLKIYYTNAILLKTETLEDKDQKQYINEIKKRRMIKNIKSSNIKQLLRKIILLLSIKQYLKFRKKVK